MSLPPLRQPKCFNNVTKPLKQNAESAKTQHVIVTLKSNKKLVITSDGYHGIIQAGDTYKCLLCDTHMELNVLKKEMHLKSFEHQKAIEKFPHLKDFTEDLIRQINPDVVYCTTCNVVVMHYNISGHLRSEVHKEEISKALNKASIYKAVI